MAAAVKDIDPKDFDPEGDLLSLIQGLQLTAMVGMIDPPRPESLDAVKSAQDANIRVRMVTGDDVVTGAAVAKQLGIPGEAILGADFAALSEAERLDRIDKIGVVGRVSPEHKVLMVQTLLKKGDVVAMTGDGVNDAPAIKAADIGIAMGTGTQVAKNAGKMILTDDNFATIVRAVSVGRKVYDNMLKYIRFMLVALVTYVVTFLMASLLNIAGGQPFTAVQILWINFLITAPVGIALGLDKATPGLMEREPRPRADSIMSPAVITTVGLVGVFMSVAINLLIVFGQTQYGKVEIGSTMGLVAFSLMLVVAAFESRDEKTSILRQETFDNKTVNITALVEIALAVLISAGVFLPGLLGTVTLSDRQWLIGAIPAVLLLVLWEIGKLIARRMERAHSVDTPMRGSAQGRERQGGEDSSSRRSSSSSTRGRARARMCCGRSTTSFTPPASTGMSASRTAQARQSIWRGRLSSTVLTRWALSAGTVRVAEVAQGIAGSGVPLVILPGGTGNGAAGEFGIPKTIAEAVGLLVDPDCRRPVRSTWGKLETSACCCAARAVLSQRSTRARRASSRATSAVLRTCGRGWRRSGASTRSTTASPATAKCTRPVASPASWRTVPASAASVHSPKESPVMTGDSTCWSSRASG